jgi:hypothetical protein
VEQTLLMLVQQDKVLLVVLVFQLLQILIQDLAAEVLVDLDKRQILALIQEFLELED